MEKRILKYVNKWMDYCLFRKIVKKRVGPATTAPLPACRQFKPGHSPPTSSRCIPAFPSPCQPPLVTQVVRCYFGPCHQLKLHSRSSASRQCKSRRSSATPSLAQAAPLFSCPPSAATSTSHAVALLLAGWQLKLHPCSPSPASHRFFCAPPHCQPLAQAAS